MKTRSGFVSNSSSSSFVIITTKEKWDAAKKAFTEKVGKNIAKVVIEEFGSPDKAKVLGQDALVFSGVISSEEYGYETVEDIRQEQKLSDEDVENLAMDAYGEQYDFLKILEEDGMSFVTSEGC